MSSPLSGRVASADALPVLVIYVVVLLGIPSELIVAPLGAAGTPAEIIAFGLLAWWLASRILLRRQSGPSNPVKRLLLALVVVLLASYVAGMSRPIGSAIEVNSSDRALLSLCAWCGVVLVLADGITSRVHLDTLLRLVAGGVTGIAVLGLIQFVFKLDIAHLFHIPGLSANHAIGGLIDRGAYQRVTGTTEHPIEFGVVLSSGLPLAIHFARFSTTHAQRRRWWIATGLIGAVLPMSVARSAILGAAIAIIYLYYTWPSWLKFRLTIAGGIGAVLMSFAVPGLLGTIRGLFLNASSDPSTQGRTADYAPVLRYTEQRPLFGRGIGTFIPDLYRTLDNQYLGLLVEAGIVGVVGFLTLVVGAGCVAGGIRRRTDSESTRNLAQSLKAGVAVIAFNAATFDAFGFPMCAGMLFLLIGAIASLRTIEPPTQLSVPSTAPSSRMLPAAIAALLAIGLGAAGYASHQAKPDYQALGTMILDPPPPPRRPVFSTTYTATTAASVLHDVMASQPVRERLARRGVADYEIALGNGSLMMGTDITGSGGPTLRVVVTASGPVAAQRQLSIVINETSSQLLRIQSQLTLPERALIKIDVLSEGQAFPVHGRALRADVGLALLTLLLTSAFVQWWRAGRRAPRSAAAGIGVAAPGHARELAGAGSSARGGVVT